MRTLFFLGMVGVSLVAPRPSSATTLTFQGGSGTFSTPFAGGIPGIYGSRDTGQPGPNQYDLIGTGWTPNIVTAWSGGLIGGANFGSLATVAQLFASGGFGQLALTPDAGFLVVLNSLEIAANPVVGPRYQTVRVLDASFNLLWGGSFLAPAVGSLTLTPNITSSGTIYLQFGTATSVGMSMVDFNQAVAPSPVPEPSTWLLLGTGLAALAARRRFAKRT